MATGFIARNTEKEFFWESPEQGHNNRIGRCHHRLWNQLQLEHAMATRSQCNPLRYMSKNGIQQDQY